MSLSVADTYSSTIAHSRAAARAEGRLGSLEAVRGLAALVVVIWHFLWAFDPAQLGGIAHGFDPGAGLIGSPALAAVDGPAAVILFFVLSGFVVPMGFLHSGRIEVAIRAAAKRWFRLVCLCLLAVLLSYALFRIGLYRYQEAANLTGSLWLGTFGGSVPQAGFQPSLVGALSEGTVLAFLHDPDTYNPVLWTMHHEFLGSFLSLALAIGVWRASLAGALWFLLSAAVITLFIDPWLLAFVAGTGLAWQRQRYGLRLPTEAAIACIAVGVFLFGYLEPTGAYAPAAALMFPGQIRYDRIAIHTISGMLILAGLTGSTAIGGMLDTTPLRLLGRLSFPIYLFHFPLLCSLASAVFVLLRPAASLPMTLLTVALVFGPALLAVAYVFARIDEAWANRINAFSARLIHAA